MKFRKQATDGAEATAGTWKSTLSEVWSSLTLRKRAEQQPAMTTAEQDQRERQRQRELKAMRQREAEEEREARARREHGRKELERRVLMYGSHFPGDIEGDFFGYRSER